jgi:hydrogenase maturation factor
MELPEGAGALGVSKTLLGEHVGRWVHAHVTCAVEIISTTKCV